ncbi:MAG: sulfotransferase family protein [Terracidiphilus sp.]
MSQSLTSEYDGHNLVFVAGCARSGTTWFQRILASHPKIRTGPESHLFDHHIGPQLIAWDSSGDPTKPRAAGLSCYFSREEFRSILKSNLVQLLNPMVQNLSPGEVFLEKTPDNALYLPQIFELLPRARVIYVLRDARDVVSSLTAPESWLFNWAPSNARMAAEFWVRRIKAVRDAMPSIPAGQFHQIRYEALLDSPVEVMRGTADFLGLDWSLADIEKAVEANRADQARKTGGTPIPVYGDRAERSGPVLVEPKGFIRRAKSGAWKKDLSLVQQFWVWRVAHATMAENGYYWSKGATLAFSPISSLVSLARGGLKKTLFGEVKRQAV